jgi:hypothetical protein
LRVDFIVCAIGFNVYLEEGDFTVLTGVNPGIELLLIMDLIKLTDSVRPKVLESSLSVACQYSHVVRCGDERIFGNN